MTPLFCLILLCVLILLAPVGVGLVQLFPRCRFWFHDYFPVTSPPQETSSGIGGLPVLYFQHTGTCRHCGHPRIRIGPKGALK